MEDAVLFSLKGQVAIITMNRPHSLNSMNEALIDGLHEALTKVEKDPAIKCAVLTGNGKAFCAGGDLPFLETLADTAVKKAFITKVGQVAKRITTIEKPIIAMVNGVTAGAGVNLMLACDLIYAVDTAKFAQSFAKVGLIPDCGGLYFLPKAVGVHKAKELMFTADLIDAATAEKMALLGNCVLTPIYPTSENPERTKEQLEMLKEEHFKKIELSDAILVINVDEYIGYSTNLEIEYAKKLNKEILYYTDLIKNKTIKI